MLNGALADWWQGKVPFQGSSAQDPRRSRRHDGEVSFEALPNMKVQNAPGGNIANVGRNGLRSYHDGSAVSMGLVERPLPPGVERVRPQAGAARIIGDVKQFNQTSNWRKGEAGSIALDGSVNKTRRALSPVRHMEWRGGDDGVLNMRHEPHSPKQGRRAQHLRPGGVGRRADPTIAPFDDGSQMSMLANMRDQRSRLRHTHEAYTLEPGTSLAVQTVSMEQHEAEVARARLRESQPHLFEDAPAPAPSNNPRRRATDVTFTLNAAEHRGHNHAYVPPEEDPNRSNWRLGDDQPFSIDFSEVRQHQNQLSANQAAWRFGDEQPFRIDHSVPEKSDKPADLASENNARQFSDVMFHKSPELLQMRQMRQQAATGVQPQYGPIAFGGPKTQEISDIVRSGLSWAEMNRRGMLPKRSASESALPTAARMQGLKFY